MHNKLFKVLFAVSIIFMTTVVANAATNHRSKPVVAIDHWKLDNGTRVYLVSSHELPMVDIKVLFDAGSARDGQLYGLAALTNSMLDEGTAKLNTDQIAEQFDNVGAIFSGGVTKDSASISLRSLTKPELLTPALNNFATVLTQASFPEKSFQRLQKQTLQSIAAEAQDPGGLSTRTFYKDLYGDYPYGHQSIGNKTTVNKITVADLKNFYQQYYVGNNAIITIVGDVSRNKAQSIAQQIAGQLPQGQKPAKLPKLKRNAKTNSEHVNYPSTQTYIRMGEVGISRDNPDYFPLQVGNYSLGGSMLTSRLFNEVRNKYGLSYNVASRFIAMKKPGPFIVNLQTNNAQATKAITVTKQVVKDYITNGPTKAEVDAAKKNMIGGFPLRLDSNSAIANNVAMIAFYNLPLNYLDTYRDNVANVNEKMIQKAFAKHLNPDKMITVTVGPTQSVEQQAKKQ